MLKLLGAASLFFAFTFDTAAIAGAQVMTPPDPTGRSYVLPGAVAGYPGDRLLEGRSIDRTEAPSTFYGGSDERGYPSGEPQNPRTGN
ncbi:MAG TPA: hypothetical protein VHT02_09435 [Methylocella sp.]|jgi:hypothetical protein|nr:hypothetical protein [Methylocella sp.]